MPATRSAEWKGDVATGTGTFTAGGLAQAGSPPTEVALEASLVA
jgi:hypothetical protein